MGSITENQLPDNDDQPDRPTGMDRPSPVSPAVERASEYLAGIPLDDVPRPIVPMLRARFGLSAVEAIQVLRQAHKRREERS